MDIVRSQLFSKNQTRSPHTDLGPRIAPPSILPANRRHHCRSCGLLLCYQCSPYMFVPHLGDGGVAVRCCRSCAGALRALPSDPATIMSGDLSDSGVRSTDDAAAGAS
jgi:hypothetical protein